MAAHYPIIRGVGGLDGMDANAASITHTIGGSTVPNVGDLILIFLGSANQTFTPVSGYLEVPDSPQGLGQAGTGNAVRLTIFYKFSDGTETTYVTGDSGNHNLVSSFIISGVDRVNPFNVTAGDTNAASTDITCPAVTTSVPECLIINAINTDRDANTVGSYFTSPSNANLANITIQVNKTSNVQQGGGFGIISGEKATAGSTGTTAVTQGASEETARITLALAPLRRRIAIT
jgi:hypothetical protein